ncbi:MAG: hypothetical protein L0H41_10205 [Microlunatus sp.]|nr:hypothetical protein [Microlunatus sp.]
MESGRLAIEGGASKPTKVLLSTSAGQYLSSTMQDLRSIKDDRLQVSDPGSLEWVRRGAYAEGELILEACEDYRSSILRRPNGKVVTPEGTRVYEQTITAKRIQSVWKLVEQDTTEVSSC